MGLIKDFLKSKKEQKSTSLNLEQENIELKQKINELTNQIKEMEMLHAEEISLIDREFLHWYNKENNRLDSKTDKQTRPEQEKVEPLDLEVKNEDLNIEELINE